MRLFNESEQPRHAAAIRLNDAFSDIAPAAALVGVAEQAQQRMAESKQADNDGDRRPEGQPHGLFKESGEPSAVAADIVFDEFVGDRLRHRIIDERDERDQAREQEPPRPRDQTRCDPPVHAGQAIVC